jgi:hypothetical protein
VYATAVRDDGAGYAIVMAGENWITARALGCSAVERSRPRPWADVARVIRPRSSLTGRTNSIPAAVSLATVASTSSHVEKNAWLRFSRRD